MALSSARPTRGDAHLWPSSQQMLLLRAALGGEEQAVAAFQEWRAGIDLTANFGWESVRLLPLVHDRMVVLGVTDDLMPRLKGVHRKAWIENQRLFHGVRPVVAALVDAGIEVLLLKGAPLAMSCYRSQGLRPMRDVDVSVRPERLHEAIAILGKHGWRCSADLSGNAMRFRHALEFRHSSELQLDLHWNVMYEAPGKEAETFFWESSEPFDYFGVGVRQLDPTSMLVLGIVHGLRWNLETPVRWIPDTVMLMRTRADVDWARVVAFALSHKLTRRLSLGLDFLAEQFDARIPSAVRSRLRLHPLSFVERLEATLSPSEGKRFTEVVANHWATLVEFARCPDASGPAALFTVLPDYLTYCWSLRRRRELVPFIARGLMRSLKKLASGSPRLTA